MTGAPYGLQTSLRHSHSDSLSQLPPSPDLHWVPCFQNYTSARLEVPLDYGDPSRGVTAIAFLKLSATNATTNTRSLLINPGGSGGSGIESVFSQGLALADCWPGNPEGRAQFEKLYFPEIYNASSTTAGRQFAAAEIFGEVCSSIVGGSNGSAAFVSTPAVARDMLSFVEAEQKQRLAKNESDNEQAKLWYYGVSYWTVLGATFAHLFPDRVERMVLDGVVEAEDYYSLGWRSNLYDADKALDSFIQSCFQAGGKERCAFWGPFPKLAAILAGLEQSNTTAYAIAVTGGTIPANPCNYAPSTATRDVDTLIRCVDGAGEKRFRSISQFEDYVDVLTSQSEFFGEVWPNNANGVACRAFEVSPPETGKLKGTILDSRRTASPILFVTTEVDPVAPKRAAHKMSSVFPGSAVLIQRSVGHTEFLRPSICFARRVRNYLLSGQLPPPNSTCQADAEPFP
ncbi:TAP-like protein-domain-containing protein [Aspergillus tetrazonus]